MGRPRSTDEPLSETAVRLPKSLHDRLRATARERGASINHLLNLAAKAYLDALPPLGPAGNSRPAKR